MTPAAFVIVAGMLAAATTRAPDLQHGHAAVRHIGRDLEALGSPSSLTLLAAGAAAALAVHPQDAQVTRSLAGAQSLEHALEPGDVIGNGYVQFAAAAATWIAGRATDRPRVAATGVELLEAQVLSGAITQGLKYAVQRTRPDGGHHSFPSGHTSATFATATVIAHRCGWKAGIAAYTLAAYVGVSRLSEREHYLSDVLAGAAIGAASGRAISLAHNRARLAAMVVPLHGGVAVVVVH